MASQENVTKAVEKLESVNKVVQEMVKKYAGMLTFMPSVKTAASDLEKAITLLKE